MQFYLCKKENVVYLMPKLCIMLTKKLQVPLNPF